MNACTSTILASILCATLASCGERKVDEPNPATTGVAATTSAPERQAPAARSAPGWAVALHEQALAAAARMPTNPHVKNRSKVQHELAEGLLALGEVERALAAAQAIANWRKGCVLADAAAVLAQRGEVAQARKLLDEAHQVAERPSDDEIQDWQRGRVRGRIARAYLRLGDAQAVDAYAQGLEPNEAQALVDERARRAPLEDFDAQHDALAAAFASQSFDAMKAALATAAIVHDRWYEDAEKRERVERLLAKSWEKLPRDLRLAAMLDMADSALRRGDKAAALRHLDEARALMQGLRWLPEHKVPADARVATLLFRAGEVDGAAELLAAALAFYDAERAKIVNIDRAGALRPLAEARVAMGDRAAALALYRRVVEEGVENPNSRPRLDDLAATVASMSRQGVEPDAALSTRIAEIAAKLGDPW